MELILPVTGQRRQLLLHSRLSLRPSPQVYIPAYSFQPGDRVCLEILESGFHESALAYSLNLFKEASHDRHPRMNNQYCHVLCRKPLKLNDRYELDSRVRHRPVYIERVATNVENFGIGEQRQQVRNPASFRRALHDQLLALTGERRLPRNVHQCQVPSSELAIRQAPHHGVLVEMPAAPSREAEMVEPDSMARVGDGELLRLRTVDIDSDIVHGPCDAATLQNCSLGQCPPAREKAGTAATNVVTYLNCGFCERRL